MLQCAYLIHCPLKYSCFKNTVELCEISLYLWLSISFCGFPLYFKSWNLVLGLQVEKLEENLFNCVHYLLLEIFIFHILFLMVFPIFSQYFLLICNLKMHVSFHNKRIESKYFVTFIIIYLLHLFIFLLMCTFKNWLVSLTFFLRNRVMLSQYYFILP